MKLHIKKLILITMLFSSTAFAFNNQSFSCVSTSNGSTLFVGNHPIAQMPAMRMVCESVGGRLVLGRPNNGGLN